VDIKDIHGKILHTSTKETLKEALEDAVGANLREADPLSGPALGEPTLWGPTLGEPTLERPTLRGPLFRLVT
jgi:hypothetical protein